MEEDAPAIAVAAAAADAGDAIPVHADEVALAAVFERVQRLREELRGTTLTDLIIPEETIGAGASSHVRLCFDQRTQRHYALKIFNKRFLLERPRELVHVVRERDVCLQEHHPFKVHLLKVLQNEVNLFFLLEFVPGGDLFEYRVQHGVYQLPEDVVRFYVAELVLALRHLHSRHIAYRDLKPENVMLDEDGHARLVDFGFAKRLDDTHRTFTMCGTREYYAPEMLRQDRLYNALAVDWWTLGVLAFELLVGYTPFHGGDNERTTLSLILHADIVLPRTVPVSEPGRDFVLRCLQRDVGRRLGCARAGVREVMQHPWFRGIDWRALERRQIAAPLRPLLRHAADTRHFTPLVVYPLARYQQPPPPSPSGDDPFAEF